MKIHVPEICDRSTLFTVLGQLFDGNGNCYSNRFLFDAQAVSEIDPVGLVMLNSLFGWLTVRGHSVHTILPQIPKDSPGSLLNYIDKDGVYRLNDAVNVHQATIPLAHVHAEKTSTWVLTVFNRWLAEVLGISTLSLFKPLLFLRLLLHYATQYGESSGVLVHSSFNRLEHLLYIVIAHYGKGIPELIRRPWSTFINDAIILAEATEKSSDISSSAAGSLSFLVDEVLIENGGNLSIYSGFGHMEGYTNVSGITQKLTMCNAYVPGTLFEIHFRLGVTGLMSRINEPMDWEYE